MASPPSVPGFAGALPAPVALRSGATLAAAGAVEAEGARSRAPARERPAKTGDDRLPEFKRIYDDHLPFMWRAARHLGVAPSATEDVLQEVFLVVHRRLAEFEGRSSLRTWMYGILLHVVRNHRRSLRRRQVETSPPMTSIEDVATAEAAGPLEAAQTAEAMRTLQALLEELDDARREVFVLVELEELTVPEIAELLGEKQNTVYGRLRAARQQFETAVRRHQARETRRNP